MRKKNKFGFIFIVFLLEYVRLYVADLFLPHHGVRLPMVELELAVCCIPVQKN